MNGVKQQAEEGRSMERWLLLLRFIWPECQFMADPTRVATRSMWSPVGASAAGVADEQGVDSRRGGVQGCYLLGRATV